MTKAKKGTKRTVNNAKKATPTKPIITSYKGKSTAEKPCDKADKGKGVEKKNTKPRKKTGWADTKFFPHLNHPAKYKKIGSDDIEYVTFTHSISVPIKDKRIATIPLTDNVSKKEREENKRKGIPKGKNKSYVYPKVFQGKRSALGKETDKYSLVEDDKKIVDNLFDTLPKEKITQTSSSKKKKKP